MAERWESMPRATSGVVWTGASIFMYQYHGVGLLRTYADFQFHFYSFGGCAALLQLGYTRVPLLVYFHFPLGYSSTPKVVKPVL